MKSVYDTKFSWIEWEGGWEWNRQDKWLPSKYQLSNKQKVTNCSHQQTYCSSQITYTYKYTTPVKWDTGNPQNSETDLFQCHFLHHKSRVDWPGPPCWEVYD
jgi:hypothetical protein